MIESAHLWLGTAAFVWTVVAIGAAVWTDANGLVTLSGVIGFVLWGVWSFASLNIIVHSGGSEFAFSHPELTVVGVMLAVPCAYLALTGPLETAKRANSTRLEDV
jgi:hypothetical protein